MLENNIYLIPRSLGNSLEYLTIIIKGIALSHTNKIEGTNFVAYGISSRGLKMTSKLISQFSKEVFRNRKYIGIIKNLGE